MSERAEQNIRQRKMRDRAVVLLLCGVIFLLPPFAGIFHLNTTVFGVPATLIYLFAVWAFLIAGARWLSARLDSGAETDANGESSKD